jgi:hypothetical protein
MKTIYCAMRVLAISATILLITSCSIFSQGEEPNPSLLKTDTLPPPTEEQKPLPIVVNLGPINVGECRGSTRAKIWSSSYPYQESQLLLADPNIDYYAPTFSPNNEWLAVVESSPKYIGPGNSTSNGKGFERVVIIKPDGSNLQTLGKDLPANEIGDRIMGCMFDSYILPFLSWSPDNNRLAFMERKYDDEKHGYYDISYLAEIGSNKLYPLLEMEVSNKPEWLNNDELLISGDGALYLFSGISKGNLEKIMISYPSEIAPESVPDVTVQNNGTLVVSFIEEKVSSDFQTSRELSVWELLLEPEIKWNKVVDYGKTAWGNPVLGNRYAVTCDDDNNRIIVLDITNWMDVGRLGLPTSMDINCGSLQVLQEKKDIAYFVVDTGAEPKLYRMVLEPGNLEPKLVFDSNQIALEPSDTGYFLNYSVENEP